MTRGRFYRPIFSITPLLIPVNLLICLIDKPCFLNSFIHSSLRVISRSCNSDILLHPVSRQQNRPLVLTLVFNYFIIGRMKKHLTKIDEHLRTMIRVIIWKQWKVPSKREWGLKKLGVNKDLARLTAYCGNRYQWVVTKTCVVRAISKEKLTKKGLVSCIDYYDSRRHNLGLN